MAFVRQLSLLTCRRHDSPELNATAAECAVAEAVHD